MTRRNALIKLYQTEAAHYANLANSSRLDIMQSMRNKVARLSRYSAADYKSARDEMGITDADQYYS